MNTRTRITTATIAALILASGITGGVVYSSRQKQDQEQTRQTQLEHAKVIKAVHIADEYFALSNRHELLLADIQRKGDEWLQIVRRNEKAYQKAREKYDKESERIRQHNIDERLRAQQEYMYRPSIWSEPGYPSMASAPPPPRFRSEADSLQKMVSEAKAFRLKSEELPSNTSTEKLQRLLSTCIVSLIDNVQENADAADKLAVAAAGRQQNDGGDGEDGDETGGYINDDHLKALKVQRNKTYNEALMTEVKTLKDTHGLNPKNTEESSSDAS